MRADRKAVVKIGYRDFVISFVKSIDNGASEGDCNTSQGKIRIVKGQDCVEKANTIIHEILHAIIHVQGVTMPSKQEETLVCAIANGLTQFIKENPRYTKRIIGLINKKQPPS